MNPSELLWNLVLLMVSVSSVGVAVKKIFFSKMASPVVVRNAEEYARVETVKELEARMLRVEEELRLSVARVHTRLDDLVQLHSRQHAEIMRALGRMEGRHLD